MSETTHAQIVAKICEELEVLDITCSVPFSADTNMTTDMKIDSIDVMELVFTLEEAFDASVPVSELSNVFTIGELATLIENSID